MAQQASGEFNAWSDRGRSSSELFRFGAHPLAITSLRAQEWDPSLDSIAEARRFVRAELVGVPSIIRNRIELLTSELATNAVVHAATRYRVVLNRHRGGVRVSVVDRAAGTPRLSRPSCTNLYGRGLYLVDIVADEWGVTPLARGKRVWFRMLT